jgi:tetrahydromethanopterin S-methyltransferase subunit G
MKGIIDGLIDDARKRSDGRRAPINHIQRRREEATAQVAKLARDYLSDADSESEVNERLEQIRHAVDFVQDERISTAEAMVSMIANGQHWESKPFWLNIQDDNGLQWKGYVHKGNITEYRLQDYQGDTFPVSLLSAVRDIDLSVKVSKLCSGGLLVYATIVRKDGGCVRHVVFNENMVFDEKKEIYELMFALLRRVFFWVGDDTVAFLVDVLAGNGLRE